MLLSVLVTNYADRETSMGRLAKSTLANYVSLIKEFVNWMDASGANGAVVADLTTYTFMCYVAEITKRVPKKAAMVRAAVRSFCKYLITVKWLNADITKDVELPKVKPGERTAPEEEIIVKLLEAVERIDAPDPKRHCYRTVLYLLVFCGLRRSEVSALRVQDVDEAGRRIYVQFGKGNHPRWVTPPGEMWPVMRQYLAQRPANPDPRLLVYSERLAMSPAAVPQIFRKVLIAAGMEGQKITCHNMRHAFATRAVRNKAPLSVVQAQLGHSKITTTAVYCHVPTNLNAIEAQYFGLSSTAAPKPPEPADPVPSPALAAIDQAKLSRRRHVVNRTRP